MFEETRHSKTYIFWHNSASTKSFTVSSTFGGGVPGGGGFSSTVTKGKSLVKMFRKAGEKHYCARCFSKKHNKLFKSVAATVYGRGYIIDVKDMKLVPPKIGSFK